MADQSPSPDQKLPKSRDEFVSSASTVARRISGYGKTIGASQAPMWAVVSCSDSRVALERLFGASYGTIFEIKTAGCCLLDSDTMGSLQYAVKSLGVRYIVVLGHSSCGAVTAAKDRASTPGADLPTLIGHIAAWGYKDGKTSSSSMDDWIKGWTKSQAEMAKTGLASLALPASETLSVESWYFDMVHETVTIIP